jgi:GNAT superfamily N-acetyltransferase
MLTRASDVLPAVKILQQAYMSTMKTSVRRAVAGDEAIVRALRLAALSDTPDAFGSTYERELARTAADWQRWVTTGATFILTSEEGAHGIVAGLRDAIDPAVAQLMSMWVDPASRGSGAADVLIAAVLSWAEEEGARVMRLAVIETNDRARRCYLRNGFRLTGKQIARKRDGAIELEMERPFPSGPRHGGSWAACR